MEIMAKRRSIRKYKDIPVDEPLLFKMIESASLAPSGSNTQPWHFIIVNDSEVKNRVVRVSHKQKWMLSAPVFIVCVADIQSRIEDTEGICLDEETSLFELKQIIRDTSIAAQHIVLEAEELGLGTCWVAWYSQKEIRKVLNIPQDKYVVGIITAGYADESPKPRPRKDYMGLIHRNQW